MWTIVRFIINPIFAIFALLFGWIGRSIDGILSPAIGMIAAVLVGLFALSIAGGAAYGLRNEAAVAFGLTEEAKVTMVEGVVAEITDSRPARKNKVKQSLVISFPVNGARQLLETTETVSTSDAYERGQPIAVYLRDGRAPTLTEPAERVVDSILVALAAIVCALILWWAWRYFRHRRRIWIASQGAAQPSFGRADPWGPSPARRTSASAPVRQKAGRPAPVLAGSASAPTQSAVLRGSAKPLTTAERMKADAERARQMHKK